MNDDAFQRLFGYWHAFDHDATRWLVGGIVGALLLGTAVVELLARTGRLPAATRAELRLRLRSWWILAPAMVVPVLCGAAATIAAVTVLSLWCYREFARATGLFRERLVSALVVLGIAATSFSAADHWYGLFGALPSLFVILLAGAGVTLDRPDGYVQRTALGMFSFLFFATCLGHLGYMANDDDYRPLLLFVLVTVEANDVFAYVCGRLFGRRRLMPRTSPNKTWGGAIGATILTTLLAAAIGPLVFAGTVVDAPRHLLALGVIAGVGGQLGDLVLSAIKRDVGIKDFAPTIPGHGGVLDRFDSVLLVAPAVFHYVGYLKGIGLENSHRLFTGA